MKYLVAVCLAAAAALTSANAAVLDFVAYSNAHPGALPNGTIVNLGGYKVALSSSPNNPFLDSTYLGRDAGLGACKVAADGVNCANIKGNDEGVQIRESLTLSFANPVNISQFSFNNSLHRSLDATNFTLIVNSVPWTFAALLGATFKDLQTLTLAWGGSRPTQFFLDSLYVTATPLPAAAPLLLSGLAGLGFAAKRKRKA